MRSLFELPTRIDFPPGGPSGHLSLSVLPARRAQRLCRGASHPLYDRFLNQPLSSHFSRHVRFSPSGTFQLGLGHSIERGMQSQPAPVPVCPLRPVSRTLVPSSLKHRFAMPLALRARQNRLARTAVANPGRFVRRRRTAGFPAASRIPPIRRIVFVRTALALGRPGPAAWRHGPAAVGRAGPFYPERTDSFFP